MDVFPGSSRSPVLAFLLALSTLLADEERRRVVVATDGSRE